MKGHRYCPGDTLESHEFTGRNVEQVLKRVGKWLDTEAGFGYIVALSLFDADGDPFYVGRSPSEPIASLTWSPE